MKIRPPFLVRQMPSWPHFWAICCFRLEETYARFFRWAYVPEIWFPGDTFRGIRRQLRREVAEIGRLALERFLAEKEVPR